MQLLTLHDKNVKILTISLCLFEIWTDHYRHLLTLHVHHIGPTTDCFGTKYCIIKNLSESKIERFILKIVYQILVRRYFSDF